MYNKIRPGKIWLDNNGKRIQAHGGSIIFDDGKFWWYGENKEGITGTATGEQCPYWHHGVKLYSSVDLYNWTDEGFAVKESDDINNPFYPAHIMDRPHIIKNEKTGKFVLWAKTARGDFNSAAFSVCVGDSLKNMQFLREIRPFPHHAGDFDLFKKDGEAYIVFENPHSEMIVRKLTDDYLDLTDECSSHLPAECPPLVREAPAFFTKNGRDFLLTSGTTGYFPNPSEVAEIKTIHGEWVCLGDACEGDKNKNSFRAQFSSVFKHPFKENLYIALGDRWLTDTPEDLPDMCEAFYSMFSQKAEKTFDAKEIPSLSDSNTSEANYVWLPVLFKPDGTPYIKWIREWQTEDFD